MNYAATFDSYDESTLKNEIKLIDDSYYRVYDDDDYEIWKERMISLVVNYHVLLYCYYLMILLYR